MKFKTITKTIIPYIIAGGIALPLIAGTKLDNSANVEPYSDYLELMESYAAGQTELKDCNAEYSILKQDFEESSIEYSIKLKEYESTIEGLDSTVSSLRDSLGVLEQKLLNETELRKKVENKKFLGIS